MSVAAARTHLLERLPQVRGQLIPHAPLARETWFRVGGPAEVMFRPADREDLAAFMAAKPKDVPVTVIGVGSNMLIRDGGVPGVVIRMGREMAEIEVEGDLVSAGAGASDVKVAAAARDAGLTGLEFLSGIPGTIGGAVRMNAGAYDDEIADILVECKALDPDGNVHKLHAGEMGFSYRHASVPEGWIFTNAVLCGRPDDRDAISLRMLRIRELREQSQPLRTRTGGSTFKNPEGNKAWKLVDEAGCRGLRIGGAIVSPKHTNFLINTGDATAGDLELLGEEVRRRVFDRFGIDLQWEIKRIGVAATPPAAGGHG